MKYYELCITFVLKENLPYREAHEFFSKVISKAMLFDADLKLKHKQHSIKNYVFGLPYPIVTANKLYLAKQAYVMNVRSFNQVFLQTIKKILNEEDCGIKVLMSQVIECKYDRIIEVITTLTPTVITINGKSWTPENGISLLQKKLHNNTAKKIKMLIPDFVEPEQNFISGIEILSNKMIVVPYKEKGVLLGTKVKLHINCDEKSQQMAFIVMGAGLGEKGSLGMGFCSKRY